MDERERRQHLAEFLRTRRARLNPEEEGVPARGRRRTPGLRREEVAERANIGVSWYTLLEQGRDVHPSRQVMASLARALDLTPAEEQHLYILAGQDTPTIAIEDEKVTSALRRVIDALSPHPAFVIGRRWDALAWNDAAEMLFHFTEPYPPHPLNVIWRFFHRAEARATDPDWEAQARNLVAQFRADYARYPDDASFQALLNDLRTASPLFRQWWDEHDVRGLPDGPRTMHHPTAGTLHFEHVTFQASLAPGLRVKVYAASPESAEKLAQMLAASH